MTQINREPWIYEDVEYSDGYHQTVFPAQDIGFGVPSKEIAEHIVKAVNCHDDLVEAVTTAIAYMGMLSADNSAIAVPYQKLLNALAAAKGAA